MIANTSTVRKLVQVQEEAQTPVHVPLFIGNERYIVTQQDVRKVQDIRLLSYSKLMPNGELIPLAVPDHASNICGSILNDIKPVLQSSQCCGNEAQILAELRSYLNRLAPTPMEVGYSSCAVAVPGIAPLARQLQWTQANCNTSAPMPLHYSSSTSTTEIEPRHFRGCSCCCCCRRAPSPEQRRTYCTRGSSTMDVDEPSPNCLSAHQQLKKKKMGRSITFDI